MEPEEESVHRTAQRLPVENPAFVLFTVNAELYAIPVQKAERVEEPGLFTPLPGSPPFLVGVGNFHGRLEAIIQLSSLLGLPPRSQSAEEKPPLWLVVRSDTLRGIFLVEDVLEVIDLTEGEAEYIPPPVESEYSLGILRWGDQMATLLNVEALLKAVQNSRALTQSANQGESADETILDS